MRLEKREKWIFKTVEKSEEGHQARSKTKPKLPKFDLTSHFKLVIHFNYRNLLASRSVCSGVLALMVSTFLSILFDWAKHLRTVPYFDWRLGPTFELKVRRLDLSSILEPFSWMRTPMEGREHFFSGSNLHALACSNWDQDIKTLKSLGSALRLQEGEQNSGISTRLGSLRLSKIQLADCFKRAWTDSERRTRRLWATKY